MLDTKKLREEFIDLLDDILTYHSTDYQTPDFEKTKNDVVDMCISQVSKKLEEQEASHKKQLDTFYYNVLKLLDTLRMTQELEHGYPQENS